MSASSGAGNGRFGSRDDPAATAARPAVSIVIPTLNGEPEFSGVMAALAGQAYPGEVEVVVIDSGSSDGTCETAERHGARILHVEQDAFDHGDTRNLAIEHAQAPLVAILSQDAEPVSSGWLAALTAPLREDPAVAAVCGRLLPRPGMDLLLRRGVEDDLNFATTRREISLPSPEAFDTLSAYEKRLHINFHDVGSCLRRSVWARLPLPRTAFGEDLMWARAVLENGGKLVFEPAAEVLHAHDYGAGSLYRRAWWDGWLNRRLLDRRPVERLTHVGVNLVRGMRADWRYLARRGVGLGGRLRAAPRSAMLQAATFFGLYRGARRTPHLPVARRLVPDRPLRILYVVHGFPPQDLAGTEVHTLNVARGAAARGHRVAVFHRVSAPDQPSYRVDAGEFEGLSVYRMVNDFRYRGVEDTYENREVEQRFLEVLEREQPDVVHFQHCLHTSVSLVSLCEGRGVPTVVTLNDFWFICPTVQMILPDRSLCRPRRAGLTCVRCARRESRAVRLGQALVGALGPCARIGPAIYSRLAARFPSLRRDVLEDARALMRRPAVTRGHLRRAGRVLAPSRFLRRQYLAFGLDAEQIIYQRYGIDVERFAATTRTPRSGPLRVGFIGSFVWYKGLHTLLEAFRGIRADQAHLSVYGNPDAPPEVRDYAAECRRIADGAPVDFAGPLPQSELSRAHANLDVLVVPSLWYENSPLVILEAQAARTPVVTSDLGGMAEMVEDGVTGRLFPRGDAAALRRCLLELADDPGRVEAMATRIRVPKGIETNVAEIDLVYRQEISRVRPAGGAVPFWTAAGNGFKASEGSVEVQGGDLALLRPRSGGPSCVTYAVPGPCAGRVRIEVTTRLLAGEESLVLAGAIYLGDERLGEIPPHSAAAAAVGSHRHTFHAICAAGPLRLTVSNEHGSAPTYMRVQRVAAYVDSAEGK